MSWASEKLEWVVENSTLAPVAVIERAIRETIEECARRAQQGTCGVSCGHGDHNGQVKAAGRILAMLGDAEKAADNVCLSCERPLRPVPGSPELDICECDAAGAPPAWDR